MAPIAHHVRLPTSGIRTRGQADLLLWATITIPRVKTISINGPGWHIQAFWAILVAAVIMLLIGIATYYESNGFADLVQKLLHLGKAGGTLYTFFDVMSSGDITRAAQAGVLEGSGYSWTGYYIAAGTHADIGYGFWVLVTGLVISAIGVYAKSK